MTRALVFVLAIATAFAQNGNPVSFTLATEDGKTRFRVGEAVNVEFRFSSSAKDQYGVWRAALTRLTRASYYDHFIVEPAEGSADPLSDAVDLAYSAGDGVSKPAPLSATPILLDLPMNEWLVIRKPGHYRVRAETKRVVPLAATDKPLTLESNTIEVDVVAPEAGWAQGQLKQAVATLEIPDPPQTATVGLVRNEAAEAAARTLRFLETPEAVAPLARFFQHGPAAAQGELGAALYASPYRKEVIAAMEAQVAAPDVGINGAYMDALIGLAKVSRFGPAPAYTAQAAEDLRRWLDEVDRPYAEKSKGVAPEYYAKLAEAVGKKRGTALALSLETLVERGPQPVPVQTAEALAANFRLLPENSQWQLLTSDWYQIAAPSIAPLLQSLAQGSGNLRDSALMRLEEIDPDAARKIILERIRKVDVSRQIYNNARVLLELPEKTLPDLDRTLTDAVEAGKTGADLLLARYASETAAPELKKWIDQSPVRLCRSPVLAAYFFRVDPDWTADTVAKVRQAAQNRPVCMISLSPSEDLLMNAGVEKQALADLSSSNLGIVRQALALLQAAGSKAAEKPMLDAFAHFHDHPSPGDPNSRGVELGFVTAVLAANRWLPDPESFVQAMMDCGLDACRNAVAAARKELEPPIAINLSTSPLPFEGVQVGLLTLLSDAQLKERIAQYPKGTQFYFEGHGEGSWYYHQREARFGRLVEEAGMKLVAKVSAGSALVR